MTWYQVVLSPADISARRNEELQEMFQGLFVSHAAKLKDAAMLARKDNNATGRYTYLFSPSAVNFALPLIVNYRGTACVSPQMADLRLCVGHADWWSDVSHL